MAIFYLRNCRNQIADIFRTLALVLHRTEGRTKIDTFKGNFPLAQLLERIAINCL